MQRDRVCAVGGVAVFLLSVVSVLGQGAQQPQARIETVYPRHVARGQTTVINVAIPSRDPVQTAEISPSTGITVSGIKGSSSETEQAIGWWEITLDVAKDAAPGNRSLVLVMRMGRSAPTTISVPTHVPTISDLGIAPPQSNQPTVELRLVVADAAGDLGDSPYVWFIAGCGGEPIVGAVRGTVSAGVVRAALPNLQKAAAADTAAAVKCDFQVRVTDSTGIESNTLKTTVEFAQPPSPEASASLAVAERGGGEWTEFVSREDRFTITFPGQPTITETTWTSQFSAILPARIYSGTQGSGRYSVTVVDYNPIERLLTERSRSLPALDLAVHAYGPGYWKTDVRSAAVYALSKFLARDAKVTSVLANFSDLVAGLLVELTNNDQSRTFASMYMHENRLVITEATVSRDSPPPLIFQQSLGWLDEDGTTKLRYQLIYYNDPDAPKPPIQGR
jgi:hypothetical protein